MGGGSAGHRARGYHIRPGGELTRDNVREWPGSDVGKLCNDGFPNSDWSGILSGAGNEGNSGA